MRFLFFLISSRASGSFTAFSLSFARSLLRPLLPACRTCLDRGIEQELQGPTLRLYIFSSPSQGDVWQTWNSVRFGQADPPNWAMANTWRVRCCKPLPHVLEHSDQGENSDTTQSWGQGIRHPCSSLGFGSKYSHILSSASAPVAFCKQTTSRVWIPSSPFVHSEGFSGNLDVTGTHWFQLPSCQSYSYLCQSHTLKQFCWFSGLSVCLQFVGRVVHPSIWAHHTALV